MPASRRGANRETTEMTSTAPIPAHQVRRLMRQAGVTIAEVARSANLSQARVRYVREHGGPWDWPLIIDEARAARDSRG